MLYPSREARELAILLKISRELDIVGDVSSTVDNPSEILAWASILTQPSIAAWRAQDSGHRYLQVTAHHHRTPVHGRVTAVLQCEQHLEFWHALALERLAPGETRRLDVPALSRAWAVMPVTAPVAPSTPEAGPKADPEPTGAESPSTGGPRPT
jgi:hypothetical protein